MDAAAGPRRLVAIDAPSALGLKRPAPEREPGTRFAPWQLRQLHLLERLQARDGGTLTPPQYTGIRDPQTLVLHSAELASYALSVADALQPLWADGEFVLLLGGDCSILLGSALALNRRGRYGLVFIDGHRDLLLPQQTRHGAAAGMDLALVTGHGPEALTRIEGRKPLIRAEDVLLIGFRDEDRWYQEEILATANASMRAVSLDAARCEEIPRALKRRLTALLAGGVEGFFIHLDVDVLNAQLMFAVDSPEPGGMLPDELIGLLQTAVGMPGCLGMQLTNYDPERDREYVCGLRLIEILAAGLEPLRDAAATRADSPEASADSAAIAAI